MLRRTIGLLCSASLFVPSPKQVAQTKSLSATLQTSDSQQDALIAMNNILEEIGVVPVGSSPSGDGENHTGKKGASSVTSNSNVATTPMQILSLSDRLVELLPRMHPLHSAVIMKRFCELGLRHEGVLYGCAWKVLKSEFTLPTLTTVADLSKEELEYTKKEQNLLVAATALTVKHIFEQRLVNDHQLVMISLGRCVEMVPFMDSICLSQTYSSLESLNRLSFTAAEMLNYETTAGAGGTLKDTRLDDDSLEVPDAAKVNAIDILADALERRLPVVIGTASGTHLVDILKGMASVGVGRQESVREVVSQAQTVQLSSHNIVDLLKLTVSVRTRIVDVLMHNAEGDLKEKMEAHLKVLILILAQKIQSVNFKRLAKNEPKLVVSLRQLCEQSSLINKELPSLWDSIRGLSLNKDALREKNRKTKSLVMGGKLDDMKIKRKPVISKITDAERYVPPQFRKQYCEKQQPVARSQRPQRSNSYQHFGVRKLPIAQRMRMKRRME